MALTSTNTPSVFSGLSGFGARMINALGRLAEGSAMARAADARRAQIDQLNAKTDAELAAMGLTRDRIATYVFRDLMYI